jgi:anti-sigma factor RsiW
MNIPQPNSELEKRLSAFLDGQALEGEKQDLEASLVNDPEARMLHDELKRGSELGRRLFDDMLKEPVPLHLVRGIKDAALPRKAVRLPAPARPALSFRPTWQQATAASVLMLFLGGSFGYMIGSQVSRPVASDLSASQAAGTRDWLDDILANYRLYARQEQRVVEIQADRPADILEWLTTGTGVTFRIPDLADSNLSLVGARLMSADGIPTGILFYRRTTDEAAGDLVALTFSRVRPETGKAVEDIRSDTGLVSWSTPIATYAIVGPSAAADLDDIAAKAAGLI